MRKSIIALAAAIAILLFAFLPAGAITFGSIDGNLHPNVGALIAVFSPGEKDLLCSGTLISPTVFMTASHCTAYLASIGIAPDQVWVTFDPSFGPGSILYKGTYHTNPAYGHDQADPHDIAVVVLDQPVTIITPAQLPPAGLLDQMKKQGTLKAQTFTAVGYGDVRDLKTGGPHNFTFDGVRRYVGQSFLSLTHSWLTISENPSTDSGGTCYGDSGGPHFLGDGSMVVALTVTGDAMCRATDKDYRVDTESARSFLEEFVTLP